MKLDKEIIKYFKKWQKETDSFQELDIEKIEFNYVFPFEDHNSISLIGSKKLGTHDEIENFNDESGLPVYDASSSILCFISEERFPSLVFQVSDDSNPDISFASEGNSSAGTNFFIHSGKYFVNNHRLVIKFLDKKYYSKYLYYRLFRMKDEYDFKRGYIPSQSELKRLKIAATVPLGNHSFEIQKALVQFIEHYKAKFDAYRQVTSALRSKIESFDKAFLPAIFSSEKEPFIVEKFNKWAEGRGYGLKFDEIDFSVGKIVGDPIHDNIICEKRMGFTPQTSEDGDITWFTVGDLGSVNDLYINEPVTKNKTSIDLIKQKVDARGTGKSEKLIPIKKGDVLVSFKLTVGVAKVYNSELFSYCNEAIDILTPKVGYLSSYLAYNCMIEYPKRGMKTNNGYTLNDDSKSEIELLLPNKIENFSSFEIQQIIVEFIEHWQDWKAEIYKRIDELESNINLTEEVLIAKVFKGAEE